MSDAFTPQALSKALRHSQQPLKTWLLRQDRLVGLGNIYACEILFAARLNPQQPAGSLTRADVGRLYRQTRAILARAIDNCGTTFSDFQGVRGSIGSYQRFLKVYRRQGQPCPRCGSIIDKLVQQQRSTFYCPTCQKSATRFR